ncbi:MAG: lysophospholipase [Acidimicrobiia bacterium]|nr:lysophospholipase [Acidimicrobiia bacterium]
MPTELVSIATPTTPLEGAFHPARSASRGSVQLFHGNTMNFYVGAPRFLPPVLTTDGWDCLAYNRRGHDVLSNRDSRRLEGGAYQTIAEALEDDALARQWLTARTGHVPVAIGHSNGGLLAATQVATQPETPALVLLSAHRGGVGVMRLMADNGLMAADRYDEMTAEARALVADGAGDELMLAPGWWNVISARTYVEFLDHCPDLLDAAPAITCPVLYIVGDEEPEDLYPVAAFDEACPGPVDTFRIAGCGHYYTGCEDAVAHKVREWLGDTLRDRENK